MSSYATELIDRFVAKGVIIDTNLLLLLVVGRFSPELVKENRFGRLSQYDFDDFGLLANLVSLFRRRLVTPHVLAEVSNWVGHLHQEQEEQCLSRFAEPFSDFEELYVEAAMLMTQERFQFLGITDMALAHLAKEYLVVTDDAKFVFHMHEMGLEPLNLNYLRPEQWLHQQR